MVKELRAENKDFDPQLSGWILLAEGLIEHFERLDVASHVIICQFAAGHCSEQGT